ncbi:MAG: hypothetical protein SNJ82_14030 [Gemmataceae bacterium]
MIRLLLSPLLLFGTLELLGPNPLWACPNCAEAVALDSDSDEEASWQLAAGYNRSIYLMIAVPYLALGLLGLVIVRRLALAPTQGNGTFSNVKENDRSTTPDGAT